MERFVYADNAATTQVTKPVLDAMLPYFCEEYANPSSLYRFGNCAKRALEQARAQVASVINAEPMEIFFTAGGSESDNWLKEILKQAKKKGKNHFITSAIEHHALIHTGERLAKEGFDVTFLPVDKYGFVDPEEVRRSIRPETALVSVMFANNEIGTIQPIKEIGQICRDAHVLFHTDAVQAAGHIKIDVKEMNIDMLSISGHKFHGPKGVGAFYCRKGISLPNLIDGGAQERNRRAGTENMPGIIGLAAALTIANDEMEETIKRVSAMRDRLIDGLLSSIPKSRLNGPREHRLPGNCNISFLGVEGESLLLHLDLEGITASSGSACASSSLDPSHVLLGIGLPHEVAHGSVRLSIGDLNTEEDIDYILEKLPAIVSGLRSMSPMWEDMQNGKVSYDEYL